MRFARLLFVAAVLVVAVAPRAFGHGERTSSDPKPGATLAQAPSDVSVDFSEPPTGSAVLKVLDGCGRNVVDELTVQNLTVAASLEEGQPGKWRVATSIISGLDGHATRDGFRFAVEGTADCTRAAPDAADDVERADSGGGLNTGLILALAGGTALLVAVALLVRRSGSKQA